MLLVLATVHLFQYYEALIGYSPPDESKLLWTSSKMRSSPDPSSKLTNIPPFYANDQKAGKQRHLLSVV